jgi:hypothetical protein
MFDCEIRNLFLRKGEVNQQRLRSPGFKICKIAVQLVRSVHHRRFDLDLARVGSHLDMIKQSLAKRGIRIGKHGHAAHGRQHLVAVECDHLFMGNHSRSFTSTGVLVLLSYRSAAYSALTSIHQDVDLITARINYHFNWGSPLVAKY